MKRLPLTETDNQNEGSITVYLTLILLLILSLLFTVIEGARVNTAKVFAERALTTAMDSVLAEYYGPLWEEYHILGYDKGAGNINSQYEQIETKLKDYMSYTFQPQKDVIPNPENSSIELYSTTTKSCKLDGETNLSDYQGKLFIKEAVDYMKYKESGDFLEQLLKKFKLIETPEKVSYIMEEKQKAQEQLVGIDENILELMKLLDGVDTNKSGLIRDNNGGIRVKNYFIKKICNQQVTMKSVGVNQNTVFQSLCNHYVNPAIYYQRIQEYINRIEQAQASIRTSEEIINSITREISALQSQLAAAGSGNLSKQEKSQRKAIENSINQKITLINLQQKQINQYKEEIKGYRSEIDQQMSLITQLIGEINPLIDKAITCINQIQTKVSTAVPVMKQYEETLTKSRDTIDDSTYQGLLDDLEKLKQYVSTDGRDNHLESMKAILLSNQSVLAKTKQRMQEANDYLLAQNYTYAKSTYQLSEKELKEYRLDGLEMDYSTLVLDKRESSSPVKAASNLLQKSVIDLVIDSGQLSKAELSQEEALPSEIAALSKESTDWLTLLARKFGQISSGDGSVETADLFQSFQDKIKINDILGNAVNESAEKYLFEEYLGEHFGSYQPDASLTSNKPSVLTYEQEYLLSGKQADQDNISNAIERIILVRTIFDFASIIADGKAREEAKLTAASIVGFSGLPVLIGIVQVIIMLTWAFAEALLDTSALLMGIEVPLIKKTVKMELPEIGLINRDYLKKKAETLRGTKEIAFGYADYVKLFLLMKNNETLALRAMDLMQTNIRLRYDNEAFHIGQCLFGYQVKTEFQVESKFTAISYIQRYLKGGNKDFQFHLDAECSY